MGSRTSLNTLPPEVFAQIAPHLPLYIRSSTFLSLALTSTGIYNLTLPLLYHDLVLGDNRSIQAALHEIGRRPDKGRLVRRLYFWSRRPPPGARSTRPFETVPHVKAPTRLGRRIRSLWRVGTSAPAPQPVIAADPPPASNPCIDIPSTLKGLAELLPLLQHLEWRIQQDWSQGWMIDNNQGMVWIPPSFWTDLRKSCPQCHTISLVHDDFLLPQILVEPQIMDTLQLLWNAPQMGENGGKELLASTIANLSISLRVLDITVSAHNDYSGAVPLFTLTFPRPESLSVNVNDLKDYTTSDAMAFWKRHPRLESISLRNTCFGKSPVFDATLITPQVYLPRLRYLRADAPEVIALSQLRPQLYSLDILASHYDEMLNLMHTFAAGSLPLLKGLAIRVSCKRFRLQSRSNKIQAVNNPTKNPEWIQRIANACPNLEELALVDIKTYLTHQVPGPGKTNNDSKLWRKLKTSLQASPRLQRFYYGAESQCGRISRGSTFDPTDMSNAREVFEACPSLTRIGVMGGDSFRAVRCILDGSVEDVVPEFGIGMLVGRDNEAFI
ncbi:hypothetical protein BKA70DRAFT_1337407 [Coprinopsis sp. MPI-PUGE-AT-0042]|nr:hypothetical protein BKA70DRAFT_1337407 [Coprinopsis sp. MPI-PUGE-AT-0042]